MTLSACKKSGVDQQIISATGNFYLDESNSADQINRVVNKLPHNLDSAAFTGSMKSTSNLTGYKIMEPLAETVTEKP